MAQKTFVDGDVLTASDVNTYLMGEGGAWTSWTPTVTQSGSVTVTNTRSRYARYGRTIHFTCYLTVTGSGTGNNEIAIALPVTAAASGDYIGQGFFFDASTTTSYPAYALAISTTACYLATPSNGIGIGKTGSAIDVALAASDILQISGTYEAAS